LSAGFFYGSLKGSASSAGWFFRVARLH